MKVMKLNLIGALYRQPKRDPWMAAGVCRGALRRKINLPKNVRTIYAVFTKTLSKSNTPDSFTIRTPGIFSGANIVEYRGDLTRRTKILLATMYRKGFRYVRIEY